MSAFEATQKKPPAQKTILKQEFRNDLSNLINTTTEAKEYFLYQMRLNPEIFHYLTLCETGTYPELAEPVLQPGTSPVTKEQAKSMYKNDCQVYYERVKSRHKLDTYMQELFLSVCYPELKLSITLDEKYKTAFALNPMNLVGIHELVWEKTLFDPSKLTEFQRKMVPMLLSFAFKGGESVSQAIKRFGVYNDFAEKTLKLPPLDEISKSEIFLESISKFSSLYQFWVKERTMPANVGDTLRALQQRMKTYIIQVNIDERTINPGKEDRRHSPPQNNLGLYSEKVRSRGDSNHYKSSQGPPPTDRNGYNNVKLVHDSNQKKLTKFKGRNQKVGPLQNDSHDTRMASSIHTNERPPNRNDYSRRNYEPQPHQQHQQHNGGNQRFKGDQAREVNSEPPNRSFSAKSNTPRTSGQDGKRNLFADSNRGPRAEKSDRGSVIPRAVYHVSRVPTFESAFETHTLQDWMSPKRNGRSLTLKNKVLLDNGSVMNVTNSDCPPELFSSQTHSTGRSISIQGVTGDIVTQNEELVPMIYGRTALSIPFAPVSLISQGLLLRDFNQFTTPDGKIVTFKSKKEIQGPNNQRKMISLRFVLRRGLFHLHDVQFAHEPLTILMAMSDSEWLNEVDDEDEFEDAENSENILLSVFGVHIQYISDEESGTESESDESTFSDSYDVSIPYWTKNMIEDTLANPVNVTTHVRLPSVDDDKYQADPDATGYDDAKLVSKFPFYSMMFDETPHPIDLLSKSEKARAIEVKTLKLGLRGISDYQLRQMIKNQLIKGCDLTPKDIDNAQLLFGNPDYKGKCKEQRQEIQVSPLAYITNRQKCECFCDVMKLSMTVMYLVGLLAPFNLLFQIPIATTTSVELQRACSLMIGFITAYGHHLNVVYFDLESGIRPLSAFFLEKGILLQLTNAKTHVSRIERAIRTIKERLRTTIQNGVIKTPQNFLNFLVESTVRVMNYEVQNKGGKEVSCPATQFGLPPLSFANILPWMAIGEVPAPPSVVSNSVFRARTQDALALSPHPSSNGIVVWIMASNRFAIRDRFFTKPMTEEWLRRLRNLESSTQSTDSNMIIDNNVDDIPSLSATDVQRGGDIRDTYSNSADKAINESDSTVIVDGEFESPPPPANGDDSAALPPANNDKEDQEIGPKRSATKSYKPSWIDPKDQENNLHDDWQEVSGTKGRFRYEEVSETSTDRKQIETFTTDSKGLKKSSRKRTPTVQHLMSSNLIETNQLKDIARSAEIKQIIDKDTLTPIMTPNKGSAELDHIMKRILNLFMLTKEKLNSDGTLQKWKARYVIDGSEQDKSGYEHAHLSAPTPTDCIIFSMVAIASYQGWVCRVIDIASAFLNTTLHEGSVVYARIAKAQVPLVLRIKPEWIKFVNLQGDIICSVNRGLYRLSESPKLFNTHLQETLTERCGYTQNKKETCLYTKGSGLEISILLVHVDDILVLTGDDEKFKGLQDQLTATYTKIVSQTESPINYLGMQLTQTEDGYEVTQTGMVLKLLEEYNVQGVKPSPSNSTFQEVDDTAPLLAKVRFNSFRTIVMTLLYIARRTRPDILFQVVWFTSRMNVATEQDMSKLLHVMKYLNGTREMGMRFAPNVQAHPMSAQVDSSHGLHQSGHGHWGLCISLYGMTVLCMSRKHKLMTRSSCESEILGVNEAGVYILFLKELLESLGIDVPNPVPIYQDNESCIGILQGESKIAMSSKHMHLRNMWIMDNIKRLEFILKYRETERMTPDVLGKSLCGYLFRRHRYGMMRWKGTRPYDDSEATFDEE